MILKKLRALWPFPKGRRFVLDDYRFNLSSIDGDIHEWLDRFPVTVQNLEIYSALAELFRRRGEFDKAIAIHQAIESQQSDTTARSAVRLELAQDYYAAGVLGQAEALLVEALDGADEALSHQAFRLWLSILESEQDWRRAVDLVNQYGIPGSGGLRLANLYCEYIEQVRREKPNSALLRFIKPVRKLNVSRRVELLAAELYAAEDMIRDAIQCYRDILIRDPRRCELVLDLLFRLSTLDHSLRAMLRFLDELYQRHPSVRLLETQLSIYQRLEEEPPEPIARLLVHQGREGRSIPLLTYWRQQQPDEVQAALDELNGTLTRNSLQETDDYVCVECGFYTEKMVWQCPQCGSWETLFSRYELEIERSLKKVT